MNLQLLAAVAVLLLFAKLAISLAQQLRSPLRTVPGPFIARLTSGWYAYKVWQGSFEEDNLKLHKRYGTIVRYAPDRYSISDPAAIKVIYGLGHSFAKSPWYSTWSSPGQWSIFGDQDVHRHAQNRRHYQAAYSMSQLVHYESFVDGCADLFVRRLSELSSADVSVDMRHWFQCYAFDVIGMVTYGKRLGFLDRGDDVGGVIDALDNHLSYATLVGIFPALHRYLFPIKNWWAGSKGAGRAYVITFTNERIREAQATPKVTPALEDTSASESFLSKFLAKHSAKPDDFTSFHVLSGCVSNMVAGSDTTAISLSAVLYYLLQNPASMRTLQDEIADFTARGELSHRPTFKDTQRMPYLQAVIKEALRLHPATGLPLERVVPDGGETISGRFFPGGSIVGINTWVAHRDQAIFGNDADTFLPERWLSDDTERVARMNHSYMPFGLGSRTCIGRHISMLEMSKLIPLLVRDFTFSLDDTLSGNHWHTHNAWFVKPIDFKVRVQVRAKSAESG